MYLHSLRAAASGSGRWRLASFISPASAEHFCRYYLDSSLMNAALLLYTYCPSFLSVLVAIFGLRFFIFAAINITGAFSE